MIRVYQDRFYNPKTKKPGNSFNACLASLLEMPLRSVPAMETKPHHEAFQMLVDMLCDAQLSMDACGSSAPKGYSICSGYAAGNVPHSILCFDGKPFHNPHPMNPTLTVVHEYWSIRSIDEAYYGAA